jgi:cation:H+ antiporter
MNGIFFNCSMLLAGFICLILGAEGLVGGGRSIGLRLGLTPLFIGLTVVAFGTSTPELVVSVQAALQGKGDISVANVVGSNIFNIACILGITALITPIRVYLTVIKADIPIMIVVSVVALWLVSQGAIARLAGFFLTLALCIYISLEYYLAMKESGAIAEPEIQQSGTGSSGSLRKDILYIIGGVALMVLGSKLLVDSVSHIARFAGISESIIGLTVVSAGTSMPELATSVIAALKRQPDIAVGNVVGSNIFNILGILGISSLLTPISAPGVTLVDLTVMVVFSVLLLPLAWTGKILKRWEGCLLLFGYGLYLWWLWPSS